MNRDGLVLACGHEAFGANFFFGGPLAACKNAAAIDAYVTESAAQVLGALGVEFYGVDLAIPPEGGAVGDVAVVACEGCFQFFLGKKLRAWILRLRCAPLRMTGKAAALRSGEPPSG